MLKVISLTLLLTASAALASAQDRALTTADFAGTWNIEAMSHQIALVIEPVDATHVTATMMMPMGAEMTLKGELVDRTISLVGVNVAADLDIEALPLPLQQAAATVWNVVASSAS